MLTVGQISAIIILLQAFGVSPGVISVVRADITPVVHAAPTQPYTPPVVQTPVQPVITPVEPVLGAVEATCSDTPTITYQAYVQPSPGGGYSQQISDPITISSGSANSVGFYVQASSACGNTFLISGLGYKNQPSSSYNPKTGGLVFMFFSDVPGTFPITFTATDGQTTGTITDSITVQ